MLSNQQTEAYFGRSYTTHFEALLWTLVRNIYDYRIPWEKIPYCTLVNILSWAINKTAIYFRRFCITQNSYNISGGGLNRLMSIHSIFKTLDSDMTKHQWTKTIKIRSNRLREIPTTVQINTRYYQKHLHLKYICSDSLQVHNPKTKTYSGFNFKI